MAFTTLNTPTSLSPADTDEVLRTGRWARVAAIGGFVLVGVMLLAGGYIAYLAYKQRDLLEMMHAMNPASPDPSLLSVLGIFYLAFLIIATLPALFLFQFAMHISNAFRNGFIPDTFSRALRAQRSLTTFTGVLVILLGLVMVLFFAGVILALTRLSAMQAMPPGMPTY